MLGFSKNFKSILLSIALVSFAVGCSEDSSDDKTVSNPFESDTVMVGPFTGTVTLNASKTYLLKGFVFVEDGAELIIPAGTVIKGDYVSRGTLVVKRGGKLTANGTAAKPIIFTAAQKSATDPRGNWGGIIINGKSTVNKPGNEGISEGNGGAYGGGATPNTSDNSGTLRYVRIEFGGTKVSPDNEVNGLTLNAVGSGTTIEYVQTHFIADDGFEMFGGTVNMKYLVSTGNDDDAIDYDNGYSGKIQFALIVQDPDKANRAHEVDNDANGTSATPYSNATISNVTAVGAGKAKANDDNNDGLYYRRNSKSKLYNYVVVNFGGFGFFVNGTGCWTHVKNNELFVKNSLFYNNADAANAGKKEIGFSGLTGVGNTQADSLVTAWSLTVGVNPNLTIPTFGTSTNYNGLVPASNPGGVTPSVPTDAFFASVNYIGAFAPGATAWTDGWTTLKK